MYTQSETTTLSPDYIQTRITIDDSTPEVLWQATHYDYDDNIQQLLRVESQAENDNTTEETETQKEETIIKRKYDTRYHGQWMPPVSALTSPHCGTRASGRKKRRTYTCKFPGCGKRFHSKSKLIEHQITMFHRKRHCFYEYYFF